MIRESSHAPSTAPPGDDDARRAPERVTIRRVETLEEYRECVAIQEETWGAGFSERVPASILLVSQKIGGVVAAAFAPEGRMLGFVFGLTGVSAGRLVHWSDLLAVRPEARGHGLGERLKRFQRELVREIGVETMRWTFDPLVARNAHLNLTRLGARVTEYVPDMYGSNTGSLLHGRVATDRFVVSWDLADDDAAHTHAVPAATPAAPVVDPIGRDGLPVFTDFPDAAAVRVAIPPDVHALAPEHRAAWRAVTREAFLAYLGRGYHVTGFHREAGGAPPCYELARPAASQA